MFSKKSQVTVFLIIGIVLLAATIVTMYFKNTIVDQKKIDKTVPEELTPVKNYVSGCLNSLATDAIIKIGKNGGYIGSTGIDKKYTKTTLNFDSKNPTDSDGIVFYPGVDWKIPYWRYFKSANTCKSNCECGSKQPELYGGDGSIQNQIETYVEENFASCVDLTRFKEFDKLTGGKVKSFVSINDQDVLVSVNYPVEGKKGNQLLKAEYFDATIPVRLKQVYLTANEITESEANYTFLERGTLNLLSSFATAQDTKKLPPFSETDLEPNSKPKKWYKADVKIKIEELLSIYTPIFSLAETANFVPRYNRYALYVLPNSNPDPNLAVTFSYLPTWPIYFDIHGRGVTGNLITAEYVTPLFNLIGVKRYNYYYDVSYPVLVRIFDKDSFNGKGYDFYFALESNIRTNHELACVGPKKQLQGPDIYTNNLCHEEQKCLNLSLDVKDAITGSKINETKLIYTCGSVSCPAYSINEGKNDFEVPQCINSLVTVSKEGYGDQVFSNTYLCGKKYTQAVELSPKIEINVSIKKKKLVKGTSGWTLSPNEEGLYPNEQATITLTRVQQDTLSSDPESTMIELNSPGTLTLSPGRYKVEIMLLYNLPDPFGNSAIVIPAESIGSGDASQVTPELSFNDTMFIGQTSLDENSGYFEITPQELIHAKKLEFYTLALGDLTKLTQNDLNELSNFNDRSKEYRVDLEPHFS